MGISSVCGPSNDTPSTHPGICPCPVLVARPYRCESSRRDRVGAWPLQLHSGVSPLSRPSSPPCASTCRSVLTVATAAVSSATSTAVMPALSRSDTYVALHFQSCCHNIIRRHRASLFYAKGNLREQRLL